MTVVQESGGPGANRGHDEIGAPRADVAPTGAQALGTRTRRSIEDHQEEIELPPYSALPATTETVSYTHLTLPTMAVV